MKNNQEQMKNGHLHELLVDGLKDVLGAEKQLLKGLRNMSKTAKSETLRNAFDTHYKETEHQIERLRKVFEHLNLTFRSKKCKAMEGLLKEAEEIIEDFEDQEEVIDAALISAAQKVEHYEIATYGCLITYADLMEHSEASDILKEIIAEYIYHKKCDNSYYRIFYDRRLLFSLDLVF